MRSISLEKGFGIVEVLIAAGLMAIVAVGIASLVVNMQTEQKRMQVRSVLTELKNRHMALLTDNNSWSATLSNNPLMACLSTNAGCVAPSGPGINTPVQLTLYYSNGTTLPSTGNNGFTESGAECSTFSTTAGVDTCPIGYSVVWEALSAGINSSVRVTIRLVYNGTTANKYQNSVEVSYRSAGTFPLYNPAVAIGKNDIQIVRNATAVGRQFTVAQTSPSPTPGGNCGVLTDTKRQLALPSAPSNGDPSNLINFRTGTYDFTFRVPGLYKCSITGVGFSVNSFNLMLRKTILPAVPPAGSVLATGNGYASMGTQSTINLETTITVSSAEADPTAISPSGAAVYSLYQYCQTAPSSGAFPDAHGMGVPAVSCMGDSTYASLTCVKMD